MNHTELREAHRRMGLSANAAARIYRVSDGRTIRRWWSGEREIPGPVEALTVALLESGDVRRYFGVQIDDQPET